MNTQQKQTSFALKSGILFWGFIALFICLLLIGRGSAVGIFPDCSADSSILICYHLNNQSSFGENSTFVHDFSNYSNNGTLSGFPYFNSTGGFLGDGDYIFNNTNQISSTDNGKFNITSGLTVSAWINTKSLVSTNGEIVSRYISQSGNRSWSLYVSGNKLNFLVSPDGTLTNNTFSSSSILSDSGYVYVAGVWNGSTMITYINGVRDVSTYRTSSSINNPVNRPIEVAKGRFTSNFNGSIDEIIVLNKSLSDEELWNYYYTYKGCINLSIDTQLGGNTTLCGGTFYNNGTADSFIGFLNIENVNNIYIDGNSSILIGNNSDTGTGIFAGGTKNIIIKNFQIYNFSKGIFTNNANNTQIFNNSIYYPELGIAIRQSGFSNIYNNYIVDYLSETTGNGIDIYGDLYGNHNISFNIINNTGQGILLESGVNKTILSNNKIYETNGTAIVLSSKTYQNKVFNNLINGTGYNAIGFFGDNNEIYSNIIYRWRHNGIDINGCSNSAFPNNNSIHENILLDSKEGITTNFVYLCNGINNTFYNELYFNNSIERGIYLNVNSTGNVFSNITMSLVDYGGIFSGYGAKNNYFYNFTLNKVSDPIFNITNSTANIIEGFQGLNNYSIALINVTNTSFGFLDGTFYYFYNLNLNSEFTINHLTSSLIYFSNNSVACSNINSCNGNINITLSPNNYSYVLDNYNLTEGVSRANSPLSITSSTNTRVSVASTLSSPITTLVVLSRKADWGNNCELISKVTYTPKNGAAQTYTGSSAKSFCVSLTSTGQNLLVNPSASSNEFVFELSSTPLSSSILRILIGILALTVVIFAAYGSFYYVRSNFDNINLELMIKFSVALLLFTIAIIILTSYISDLI